MAFPRSFRQETWFVRLPSGEIEFSEAGALEDAYRCGLVGRNAPVRPVGSQVWTTLAEAAELEPEQRDSFLSVAPSSFDAAVTEDLAQNMASWRAGGSVTPRAFRSRMGTLARAFVAVGVVATIASGVALGRAAGPAAFAAARAASMAPADAPSAAPAAPVVTVRIPARGDEHEHVARSTRGEVVPAVDLFATKRPRVPVRMPRRIDGPSAVATPHRGSGSSDPFGQTGDRHDPLNGSL